MRYDDPETKTFKLNVERQNGRAAMLGITGMILHELVGVPAWPGLVEGGITFGHLLLVFTADLSKSARCVSVHYVLQCILNQ